MTKRRELSLVQHQETGLQLADIRERLNRLCLTLSTVYPNASPVGRLTGRSPAPKPCQAIDALREALTDAMLAEHKGDAKATRKVYWPEGTN